LQPTFNYKWYLKDGYPAPGVAQHGCNVFGTFICGGGSTMGYKLAGFNHMGGVEIDGQIAEVYKVNHHPKYLYQEDIRTFINKPELPPELYGLDILDGSPPCSSFSMSGNRETDWGKHKVFREGQAFQRLDDLFFDFIELADKLKPKVIIAENVKGLICGNAKAYVKAIVDAFTCIGYKVQIFLFNAASMGVPQKRERVFFICRQKNLDWPDLQMSFNAASITFGEIEDQVDPVIGKSATDFMIPFWEKTRPGDSFSKVHPKGHYFNSFKISRNKVLNTIGADEGCGLFHYKYPNRISDGCLKLCGSFPVDYQFLKVKPQYLIGMSVPPVMMANVAYQVYDQWFKPRI
jgi:DNA (cytosine-5)-methyltransferase 1